jgi:hypothetical protein
LAARVLAVRLAGAVLARAAAGFRVCPVGAFRAVLRAAVFRAAGLRPAVFWACLRAELRADFRAVFAVVVARRLAAPFRAFALAIRPSLLRLTLTVRL